MCVLFVKIGNAHTSIHYISVDEIAGPQFPFNCETTSLWGIAVRFSNIVRSHITYQNEKASFLFLCVWVSHLWLVSHTENSISASRNLNGEMTSEKSLFVLRFIRLDYWSNGSRLPVSQVLLYTWKMNTNFLRIICESSAILNPWSYSIHFDPSFFDQYLFALRAQYYHRPANKYRINCIFIVRICFYMSLWICIFTVCNEIFHISTYIQIYEYVWSIVKWYLFYCCKTNLCLLQNKFKCYCVCINLFIFTVNNVVGK